MLDTEYRSALIIGEQAEAFRVVHLRENINDRQIVGAEIDRRTSIRARAVITRPSICSSEQLIEVLAFARWIIRRVAHEDRDTVVLRAVPSSASKLGSVKRPKLSLDSIRP